MRAQVARLDLTREKMRRAFSDLVVGDKLLDALGPALISAECDFPLRFERHREDDGRGAADARI